MQTFLKFRYFLLFSLLFSCKDAAVTKTTSESISENETTAIQPTIEKTKRILFFGDSLTAGYGLESEEDAFPALIQQRLDSLQLDFTVVNAGLSGETTASGKSRLNWVLNQDVDYFVLELGANDGLRGIPLEETRANLQAIIDMVLQKNPATVVVMAGMQIPPNMGTTYTKEFRKIFPELAAQNNIALIPFLLANVAGIPELNQADGIHPTTEAQKILADNVWEILKELVQS